MEPSLVTNAYVRASEKGHIEIPEANLTHSDNPKELADKLSKEYAKLVEDNPEYEFSIIHDPKKELVTVRWKKR